VAAATRRQLTGDLVAWVRDWTADRQGAGRIKAAVIESKTSLVGPMVAAKLLGEVGDLRRFPTKDQVAAHSGTAPLEASSGHQVRHRLSRARDGKGNHALHMMAIVQIGHSTARETEYRPKRAEARPPGSLGVPEAAAVGAVERWLLADHQHPMGPIRDREDASWCR
jgi:transposase